MRAPLATLVLLFLTLFAGCLEEDGGADGSGDGQAAGGAGHPDGYRMGVVLLTDEFTAVAGQEAAFDIVFTGDERNVILEIQQDSGVMPNLHVRIGSCGELDPPASAGWQAYPVCDEANAESTQVTITVNTGAPTGTGRFLVRADLPGA